MRPALVVSALTLACVAPLAAAPSGSAEYVIVVHEANPVAEIRADDLARLFLRTVRRWESGTAVEPVDQSLSSLLRNRFSREVLGKTPGQLQEYWLRETFSGRELPPPVRASDAAVLDYVRASEGAIGYVSAAASLPLGVKTVVVSGVRTAAIAR